MATGGNEISSGGDSSTLDGCVTPCAKVALRYRANQIFVNMDSVCGCGDVGALTRIPGAPKNVKGLILFKGEAIPLISFFGGTSERSPRERLTQKGKTDDYVVIFSIGGTKFAARVDEPPRICTDMNAPENARNNACYMRRKHLERLFALCVAYGSGDDRTARCHQPKSGSGENVVVRAEEFPETSPAIAGPCCAT